MTRIFLTKLTCSLLACLAIGCGGVELPKPVPVTGRVTQTGKPVAGATIGFTAIGAGLPAKYRYVSGTTDDTGMFQIEEVYPTEYMVTVTESTASTEIPADAAAVVPASANAGKLAKYSGNSPLRANVTSDETSFEFKLD